MNKRFLFLSALLAAPFLFGAKGGCGGEVAIGAVDAGPADTGASTCPATYTPDGAGNCCKKLASGIGECIGTVTDGGAPLVCSTTDCGPSPDIATIKCSDGSAGGFTGKCLPQAGGCKWEIRDCPAAPGACKVTGCSGEICSDTDVASDCLWHESYACYKKHGVCTRDAAGKCGWKPTEELKACLGGGTSSSCGGLAGVACTAGYYCDYPIETKCGAADQMGTCKTKPEACTEEYAPVCGCDGKTYSNWCSANAAGMSVVAIGECPK